jgi:beta-N-acetylhexosaminidase
MQSVIAPRRIAAGMVVVLAAATLGACGTRESAVPRAASSSSGSCTVSQDPDTWSLARLAWQTVTVPVEESDVSAVTAQVASGAGGVILFGSTAPADLGTELQHLTARAPGGVVPLVMTDEEGGTVQRMANVVGSMPSARQMAGTMTTGQVRGLAQHVGARMRAAGVTMDLAPVLDLDDRPGPDAHNPDGTRSFGIDPSRTAAYGLAFAQGVAAGGVLPVVKHFPGLGGVTANTDDGAAWTRRWSVLRRRDLQPFRAAVRAGVPAVMVSTARVRGLTRQPAVLTPRLVNGQLRRRLGFEGLVVTDALSGGAVRAAGYSVPQAAVQALRSGADLILFNADRDDVPGETSRIVRAIVKAARHGRLRPGRLRDAVRHILAAKDTVTCP